MSDAIPAGAVARLTPTAARWAVPVVLVPAAAALVGGAAAGRPWLAAAVIVVQAVLVLGWLVLLTASLDAGVLVVIGVGAADVVLLRTDLSTGGSIVGVIGLGVVAVLLHQLALRHRQAVTANVAANLSAIVLGAAPALLLPLRALAQGRSIGYVSVISAAAAVALARLLSTRTEVGDLIARLAGLVVAGAVGVAIGAPSGGISVGDALAAGLSTGVAALFVDRVLLRVKVPQARGASLWALVTVSALVPLALASPIAYLAGRIITPGIG